MVYVMKMEIADDLNTQTSGYLMRMNTMLMALQKDAEGALEIYYFGIVCYFYLMNRDLLVWTVQTMSLVG